jgi:hypothetical protein
LVGSYLFIFWGLLLIEFICLLLFVLLEKRYGLQILTGIGLGLEVIFTLLGFIFIIFVIIFGDFCTKPTYNVLNSMSGMGDIVSIANYYATCQGNTSVQGDIHTAYGYIDDLQKQLNTIASTPYCHNDTNLAAMNQTVLYVNSTLNHVEYITSCHSIQPIWFTLFNDGICTQFYSGIFYTWGAQILTCATFFIALVIVSINYQFYPKIPIPHIKKHHRGSSGGFMMHLLNRRDSSNDSLLNVDIDHGGEDDDDGDDTAMPRDSTTIATGVHNEDDEETAV